MDVYGQKWTWTGFPALAPALAPARKLAVATQHRMRKAFGVRKSSFALARGLFGIKYFDRSLLKSPHNKAKEDFRTPNAPRMRC